MTPEALAGWHAPRRKTRGGQWLEEKHGARSRRNWRKFHLAVDANSGEIIAHRLTIQGGQDRIFSEGSERFRSASTAVAPGPPLPTLHLIRICRSGFEMNHQPDRIRQLGRISGHDLDEQLTLPTDPLDR
ncbi:hypothetical protein BMJ31_29510 [Sinorhizobium medicae]|nr:hypothetical protein BMJ31_29510 [Sinorhizobium medicae]